MTQWPGGAVLLLLVAGLGTACSTTPVVTPPGATTPSPTSSTTPVSASPTSGAPVFTPSPTPVPAPPPEIILMKDGAVTAVDPSGQTLWSKSKAELETLLPAPSYSTITVHVAGSRLLLLRATDQNATGHLILLDSAGHQIGSGTFPGGIGAGDGVFGSPDGSEWAYSIDDTPTSSQKHHGSIVVGGLGLSPRTVYNWVAPQDSSEYLGGWTDMGIVMERFSSGGCGIGFHPDTASFLIDPTSGTLTNLFSGGDHYGDARHGVRVAFVGNSPSAVTVNGVSFDGPNTIADGVYVAPDGARVGVRRFSAGGCAGEPAPSLNTQVILVAEGTTVDLHGCGISAWLDAEHFICNRFNEDDKPRVEALDGSGGSVLGSGRVVAVLPEA